MSWLSKLINVLFPAPRICSIDKQRMDFVEGVWICPNGHVIDPNSTAKLPPKEKPTGEI